MCGEKNTEINSEFLMGILTILAKDSQLNNTVKSHVSL